MNMSTNMAYLIGGGEGRPWAAWVSTLVEVAVVVALILIRD